jgi:hypothetical protein
MKIIDFDKYSDDSIMMSYLISHARLLNILGFTRDGSLIRDLKTIALWIIHSDFVNSFRDDMNTYE